MSLQELANLPSVIQRPDFDMPRRLTMSIKSGDSIGLLGMRGSGKTTFGKRLYRFMRDAVPRASGYVIDANAAGDFRGWTGHYEGLTPPLVQPGEQLVWRPSGADNATFEAFFARLFRFGTPAVLLMDEVTALGKGEHRAWDTLFKRGRTRGLTIIAHSQEFAQRSDVPRSTFSQVRHFVKFYVQNRYDSAAANNLLRLDAKSEPMHAHGLFYGLMEPPVRAQYVPGMEAIELCLTR